MREKIIVILLFLVSRSLIHFLGVELDMTALADYWQYPDIETLQHNLFKGVFFQNAQPPLFSIVLGILLKGGNIAFIIFFKLLSLASALLLLTIVSCITQNRLLALIISVVYLLSPSTILLENELFYTGFISCLLLLGVYAFHRLAQRHSFKWALLAFSCLGTICLTRSFYHLGWLILLTGLVCAYWWPRKKTRQVLFAGLIPILIVFGWYLKNYFIFNQFGTTSWTGMNLARITFHNQKILDSSSIASYETFLPVSYYDKYVPVRDTVEFPGNNRKVLGAEMKNGRHINLYNIRYQKISEQYKTAVVEQVKKAPLAYLKNVAQAMIILFTPATSYFKLENNERKIKYVDAALTLNFSAFFDTEGQQKKSLAVSAIVIALSYLVVLNYFRKMAQSSWPFSMMNIFILFTIAYVFLVGSFFEYGENMRFRYEIQPLFLVLLAQFAEAFRRRRTILFSGK